MKGLHDLVPGLGDGTSPDVELLIHSLGRVRGSGLLYGWALVLCVADRLFGLDAVLTIGYI